MAEQNIEEVLKRIFVTQLFGFHDVQENRSWVRFSLSMIKKELDQMNCSISIDQIKHSLEIMRLCIITLYENEKEVYSEPLLSSYVGVSRDEYLDDTSSLHSVRLPLFISYAVNKGIYRQFNLS